MQVRYQAALRPERRNSTPAARASSLKLVFSIDDGTLNAEGTIARVHPGSGVAVQFKEMSRESREKMYRILEFVQSKTTLYNDRYMQNLLKR